MLPQLNGPEVEIVGTNLVNGILDIAASNVTVEGLSLHGGGNFSLFGTGSGTIDIQSGDTILVQGNVLGAGAASYTLPVGAQTQDNLVRITGGTNITIQQNLLGFTRWRTILFLSLTIGNVTIQDNEIKGSFDGVDFGNVGIGPNGTVLITRNLIHESMENGSGSTEFAFFVTQTGSGSTSILGNTVRNVDVGAVVDSTRPVLFQHNVVTGGINDAIVHVSGSMPLSIHQNAISGNLLGIDLGTNGVTPNDGLKPAGAPNSGMDCPVITSASLPGGGFLSIEGYVGSDPAGSATFADAVVSVFKAHNVPPNQKGEIVLADGLNVPHGEGATFLANLTADGMGLFAGNVVVPGGVTLLPGDQITATATDTLVGGNTSEFGPNVPLPSVLDIDANGLTDALTDGLLILRAFFGFSGPTLTSGAVGGGCQRCGADAIAEHVTALDLFLDIDGNDAVDALTDGLLILRHLFGFTGATLTSGAVGGGCERCDAAAIEPHLQTLD